jgi:hypothetical protein
MELDKSLPNTSTPELTTPWSFWSYSSIFRSISFATPKPCETDIAMELGGIYLQMALVSEKMARFFFSTAHDLSTSTWSLAWPLPMARRRPPAAPTPPRRSLLICPLRGLCSTPAQPPAPPRCNFLLLLGLPPARRDLLLCPLHGLCSTLARPSTLPLTQPPAPARSASYPATRSASCPASSTTFARPRSYIEIIYKR